MDIQLKFNLFKKAFHLVINDYLPVEISISILDGLIYRFSWWTLEENYILYHKRYFDIYVDPTNKRIANSICEKSDIAREVLSLFASGSEFWIKLDFYFLDKEYISIDNDYNAIGFDTVETAKLYAAEENSKGNEMIVLHLKKFHISTLQDCYILENNWSSSTLKYYSER